MNVQLGGLQTIQTWDFGQTMSLSGKPDPVYKKDFALSIGIDLQSPMHACMHVQLGGLRTIEAWGLMQLYFYLVRL